MAQAMTPIYAEIVKIDEEQRMVFGYASTEKRDQQGEIVRHSAIQSALPDYMQFANIREMHQPSAVGTAHEAVMDDKGLWLGAKVVDDAAWNKVKHKVYKGFSIGGKVTSRDPNDRTIITGLDLSEISLVDRPANGEATFQLIKRSEGTLWPQPVQVWFCGDNSHQHLAKDEAASCLMKQLANRAQPRTLDGKLATSEQTFREAASQAEHHQETAEGFMLTAEKHRKIADKALDDGDNTSEVMHRQLQHGGERLAEEHKRHAEHYRALAAQHKEQNMTTKTAAELAAEQADAIVNKLADAVNSSASGTVDGDVITKSMMIDHEAASKKYGELGAEHKAHAKKHDASAKSMMESAKKARESGDEAGAKRHEKHAKAHLEIAAHHHTMASHYEELEEFHKKHAKTEKNSIVSFTKLPLVKVGGGPMAEGEDPPTVDHEVEAEHAREWASHHDMVRDTHLSAGKESDAAMREAHVAGEHEKAESHQKMGAMHRIAAQHHGVIASGYQDMVEYHKAMGAAGGYEEHGGQLAEKVLLGTELKKDSEGNFTDSNGLNWFGKREFSDKQREHLAGTGAALPDGSYPIENKKDLENAIHAYGRAKDKPKAKAHIIARAKALGESAMIPENWEKTAKSADMKCGKCGKAIEEHGKCPHCGEMTKAEGLKCGACGKGIEKHSEECPHCGKATKSSHKAKKVAALGSVAKGMHIIACLAHMLEEIHRLQESSEIEQVLEGDDGEIPAKLQEWLSSGATLLRDIVAEETEELIEDEDIEVRGGETDEMMIERAAKNLTWPASIAAALREAAVANTEGRVVRKKIADGFDRLASKLSKQVAVVKENATVVKAVSTERDVAVAALDKMTKRVQPLIAEVVAIKKRDAERATEVDSLKKRLADLEAQPRDSKGYGPHATSVINKNQDSTVVPIFERIKDIPPGLERARALLDTPYIPVSR